MKVTASRSAASGRRARHRLAPGAAGADADESAPARELVDGGGRVRDDQGMAGDRIGDSLSDADLLRAERGHRHHRVDFPAEEGDVHHRDVLEPALLRDAGVVAHFVDALGPSDSHCKVHGRSPLRRRSSRRRMLAAMPGRHVSRISYCGRPICSRSRERWRSVEIRDAPLPARGGKDSSRSVRAGVMAWSGHLRLAFTPAPAGPGCPTPMRSRPADATPDPR